MTDRTARKRRTRQHIIADLSANYVERYALLCGFSVERVEKDYGYDLILFTFDNNGELENGQVYIQVKATEQVKRLKRTPTISFPLEKANLESWLPEPMPVILALYDAAEDKAYWLYLQAYFESNRPDARGKKTQSVRIDEGNLVDTQSVNLWRRYKADVLVQLDGVIRHNA
jgi:hypothetical protein